jgi:hypothetical protein
MTQTDESRDMNSVGLVTPTYGRDLERCALLCGSVDGYVTSFTKHDLIVADEELTLFARFNGARREVMPRRLLGGVLLRTARAPGPLGARPAEAERRVA